MRGKDLRWSLRYYLADIVLFIGAGLVVGYTFVAGSFFRQGIDTYILSQMHGAAELYQRNPQVFES